MKKPVFVQIPKPCHEDWNAMTPQTRGRYCNSCEKTVTDFSQMTDSQVIEFLKNSKKAVCGSFRMEQINRPLEPVFTNKNTFWKRVFIACTVLLAGIPRFISVSAKGNILGTTLVENKDNAQPISGIVLNEKTGLAIAGVKVSYMDSNYSVFTDTMGRFTLYADQMETSKIVKLFFEKEGYTPVEYVSELGTIPAQIDLTMDPSGAKPGEPIEIKQINNTEKEIPFYLMGDTVLSEIEPFAEWKCKTMDEAGNPILGATITLHENGVLIATGTTDSNGFWMNEFLKPGIEYTVTCFKPGYHKMELGSIILRKGMNEELIIAMDSAKLMGKINLGIRGEAALIRATGRIANPFK